MSLTVCFQDFTVIYVSVCMSSWVCMHHMHACVPAEHPSGLQSQTVVSATWWSHEHTVCKPSSLQPTLLNVEFWLYGYIHNNLPHQFEPRALGLLGKHFATELHLQNRSTFSKIFLTGFFPFSFSFSSFLSFSLFLFFRSRKCCWVISADGN